MRRPTTAAPPGWPARHAISPRRVRRSAARAWGSARWRASAACRRSRGRAGRPRRPPSRRWRRARCRSGATSPAPRSPRGVRRCRAPRRGPAAGARSPGARARRPSPPGSARTCAGRRPSASPSRRPCGFAAVFVFAARLRASRRLRLRAACGFAARWRVGASPRGFPRGRLGGGRRLERARRGGASRAASASLRRPSSPRRPSRSRSAARRRGPGRCCRAVASDPLRAGARERSEHARLVLLRLRLLLLGLVSHEHPSVGCRVRTRRTPAEHLRHPDHFAAPSCPLSRSLSRVRTIDDRFSSS